MQEKVHDQASVQAPLVLVERPERGIAVVTLNKPDTRNALSVGLIGALHDAITALSADASVSAIVIAAKGPAFSAGHDLKELTAHRADADGGRAFFKETMDACAGLMLAIVNSPKPVIAAVEATATAAGCQLVATCDLAIAAETAKFCTPGVNIGLFCSTPMVALTRNLPRKAAMEMLLTGAFVDAETALRWGLVNRVVPRDRLDAAVGELAATIAGKSPAAVALGKRLFYPQLEASLEAAYALAAETMTENMMTEDAQAGIDAFLDKRPMPEWSGR